MREEVKSTKQKHIDSLDCSKKAWKIFEQTPVTKDDIAEAEEYLLGENNNSSGLAGKFVEKDLLCHVPFAWQSLLIAITEHPAPNNLDKKSEKAYMNKISIETYEKYASFLDKPYDIAVGYHLSQRVFDQCLITDFYNKKLISTSEKLVDIFESYINHIIFSECKDQSAMNNLKKIEGVEFSMMSYDEAVSAIGEVMDAENAAHTEL